MKKKLSVRELFHSGWTSFGENITHWLFLCGMQIFAACGFLLCCAIVLAFLHYFFVDLCLFDCLLKDYSGLFTSSMVGVASAVGTFCWILFPIMYEQNALDCVFHRKMSGFDINNRFFSYALATFFYWILVASAGLLFILPGLFLAQRWRFAGLYLLDHGGNIRKAFRASWVMTRGYIWFLMGVSMLQWLFFMFFGATGLLLLVAFAINRLIDAHIYKILHMEFDKNLVVCACEA